MTDTRPDAPREPAVIGDGRLDPELIANAFARHRAWFGPYWIDEDEARNLRLVQAEIAEALLEKPEITGELRVALLGTGLEDEAWWQLYTAVKRDLRENQPENELPVVREIQRQFVSRLNGALGAALGDEADWVLNELFSSHHWSQSTEPLKTDSLPLFTFRDPLHVDDLAQEIPDFLTAVGFEETTIRIVAAAIWAAWLQDMIERRSHPSNRFLAAFLWAFSKLDWLPPGLAHYLACRLHPKIHYPSSKGGRPARRRSVRATVARKERTLALHVYLLWQLYQLAGVSNPQEAALEKVAEGCGMDITDVNILWSKYGAITSFLKDVLYDKCHPGVAAALSQRMSQLYGPLPDIGGG